MKKSKFLKINQKNSRSKNKKQRQLGSANLKKCESCIYVLFAIMEVDIMSDKFTKKTGGKSKVGSSKKSCQINIRVSEKERIKIKKHAQKNDLSISEYIRMKALSSVISKNDRTAMLLVLLDEIVRKVKDDHICDSDTMNEFERKIDEAWKSCL